MKTCNLPSKLPSTSQLHQRPPELICKMDSTALGMEHKWVCSTWPRNEVLGHRLMLRADFIFFQRFCRHYLWLKRYFFPSQRHVKSIYTEIGFLLKLKNHLSDTLYIIKKIYITIILWDVSKALKYICKLKIVLWLSKLRTGHILQGFQPQNILGMGEILKLLKEICCVFP